MRLLPAAMIACLLLLPAASAASQRVVDVTLQDQGCPPGQRFCIVPATIETEPEDNLMLRVTNAAKSPHNLTFAPGTPEPLAQHGHPAHIPPGGNATVELPWEDLQEALDEAEGRSFTLVCGIDGHRELGEEATLTIGGGQGADENPQPLGWGWALVGLVAAALLLRRR